MPRYDSTSSLLSGRGVDESVGERLGQLAGAIGITLSAFAGFSFVVALVEGEPLRQLTTVRGYAQLGSVVGSVWVWRVAMKASGRRLAALDVGYTTLLSLATCLILWGRSYADGADLIALLVTTLTLLARSALVPSTVRRTLLTGALVVLPVVALGATGIQDVVEPLRLVFTTLWSAAVVAVAGVCSRIAYSLRTEVITAKKLGAYELSHIIGEGGMGRVYKAKHARLQRPAAIKLLKAGHVSETALSRFEREAQITSELKHPNTVSVYDYGRSGTGELFYVMEMLEGASLQQLVTVAGPLPPERVVFLMQQAVAALGEAHEKGLVHRDIKPANIFVSDRAGMGDFVKVLDFGLAHSFRDDKQDLAIRGTPQFLAPETLAPGAAVDGRADLYAIGVTAYYLLTGSHPFEGRSLKSFYQAHTSQPPPPPSLRVNNVDEALEAIILRCLEKDPAKRFADAGDLLLALSAVPAWTHWDHSVAHRWWLKNAASLSMEQAKSVAQFESTRRVHPALGRGFANLA